MSYSLTNVGWKYSPALDQLRFFTAALIFFHHFAGFSTIPQNVSFLKTWMHYIELNGQIGVSVFLVLSSFLFTMNCSGGEKKINYIHFIKRRFLRIFPIYFLIMILLMAQTRSNWSVDDFLRFILFQVNTGHGYTGFGHQYFPTGPIWTVGVEFQFYIIFPFIISAFTAFDFKRLFLFIPIFIFLRILIGIHTLGPISYWNCYHTLLGRGDQFIIGIIVAGCYMKYGNKLKKNVALAGLFLCLAVSMVYMIYLNVDSFPFSIVSFSMEAVLAGFIIVFFHHIGGIKGFIGKITQKLGKTSYSFYLFHLPVGGILFHKFSPLLHFEHFDHFMKVLLLAFVPTTFFSIVTYYTIESPFMKLSSK